MIYVQHLNKERPSTLLPGQLAIPMRTTSPSSFKTPLSHHFHPPSTPTDRPLLHQPYSAGLETRFPAALPPCSREPPHPSLSVCHRDFQLWPVIRPAPAAILVSPFLNLYLVEALPPAQLRPLADAEPASFEDGVEFLGFGVLWVGLGDDGATAVSAEDGGCGFFAHVGLRLGVGFDRLRASSFYAYKQQKEHVVRSMYGGADIYGHRLGDVSAN